MTGTNSVLGWYIGGDRDEQGQLVTRHSEAKPIFTGATLTLDSDDRIVLCETGYHASREAHQALQYASSFDVSRVELSGDIEEGDDKLAARTRTHLFVFDGKETILKFAAIAARWSLLITGNADPRSVQATRVVWRFAEGKASETDVNAAADAAADAAYAADAARAAARAAANAAYAARAAARAAARSADAARAARAAARAANAAYAARSAAKAADNAAYAAANAANAAARAANAAADAAYAARAAANAAAYDAAYDAARAAYAAAYDALSAKLERMLLREMKKRGYSEQSEVQQ